MKNSQQSRAKMGKEYSNQANQASKEGAKEKIIERKLKIAVRSQKNDTI